MLINTYLYSVYGSVKAKTRKDPDLIDYRNRWLKALLVGGKIDAVIALGQAADEAWRVLESDAGRAGCKLRLPGGDAPNPAGKLFQERQDQARGGDKEAASELERGVAGSVAARCNIPTRRRLFILYGESWADGDRLGIPEFDFPAGLPAWMREHDGWAKRAGGDDIAKRRNITITVPKGVLSMTDAQRHWYPLAGSERRTAERTTSKRRRSRGPSTRSPAQSWRLTGRVVTMDEAFTVKADAVIYIDQGSIVAVQDRAMAAPAGFEDIALVDTGGTLFPGLIELHNHLSYNALPLWSPVPKLFQDRGQWPGHPDYRKLISGPMTVVGEYRDAQDKPALLAPLVRYVECKCLLGGVTTS